MGRAKAGLRPRDTKYTDIRSITRPFTDLVTQAKDMIDEQKRSMGWSERKKNLFIQQIDLFDR